MTQPRISRPPVTPLVAAALLLAARRFLEDHDLPRPTAAAVLAATGAGRTRAYQLADAILESVPQLERPPGRPAAPPTPEAPPTDGEAISHEVIEYLIAHPGCVTGDKRRRYSDGYRHLVVELRQRFPAVPAPALAAAVCVPEATLADWLRAATAALPAVEAATDQDKAEPGDDADAPAAEATSGGASDGDASATASPRIQTILNAWEKWQGPFTKFCNHVEHELRVSYGPTFISSVLAVHGVRIPRRRAGRSPDELALRNAFTTFFPGAQWVGDGTQISVTINRTRFTFNLELDVDAYSAAVVGAAVTEEEDSAAVIGAFRDGVHTTGEPPLALLLDNRDSNHTDAVDAALGVDTIKVRSTLGRAQNKAHVEGAFGLFQQTAPPLEIEARTTEDFAAAMLALIVQTWGRTLNHKPRTDRGGSSRAGIYREAKPTNEQVEAAKRALEARRQQQDKARETRRARQDPIARALLDRHFDRLGLDDSDGNTRRAIARYPLDAIVAGIAVFEGKRDAKTLPDGVGLRYLLGIVRNIAHRDKDRAMTESLIRLRLEARDLALAPLDACRRQLLRDLFDPEDRIKHMLDHVVDADRQIDRVFWLRAAADILADQPLSEQLDLFRRAAARVATAYRMPHPLRQETIEYLARECPALQCT